MKEFLIIYTIISYLIVLGMFISEKKDSFNSSFTSFIMFLIAPISLPVCIGVLINEIGDDYYNKSKDKFDEI